MSLHVKSVGVLLIVVAFVLGGAGIIRPADAAAAGRWSVTVVDRDFNAVPDSSVSADQSFDYATVPVPVYADDEIRLTWNYYAGDKPGSFCNAQGDSRKWNDAIVRPPVTLTVFGELKDTAGGQGFQEEPGSHHYAITCDSPLGIPFKLVSSGDEWWSGLIRVDVLPTERPEVTLPG